MFDPWGAVTMVQDGAGNNLTHLTFFDRGYTGHEHMQSVGLINMNARLYNPTFHRFLEADNFVQDPYNTQNYNRYGYCVNNPLKYTDVTGNIFNIATTLGCIPVVGSIFSSLLMHQTIDWGRVAEDAVITGISIGVTFGIGQACATITNFYSRMAVSALAHGVFQGGMTAASGGKFWAGFAAGAVSSIAASFWQGGTNNIENPETGEMESVAGTGMKGIGAGTGAVGTIAFGTIMGGAASSLAGGNFWQGAVSGMIVSTFNHVMHDGSNDEDGDPKPKSKSKLKQSDKSSIQDWERIPDKDIPQVKDLGWDHGDKNGGKGGGGKDLYRNKRTGQINERPRNAPRGVIGEDTGYNWNDVGKKITIPIIAVGATYGVYVGVKWTLAIILAPETGCGSLILAGSTP